MLNLLSLPVLNLRDDSLYRTSYFYPKEGGINNNQERDFTHSEQYALFQGFLKSNSNPKTTKFQMFLEACYKKINLHTPVMPNISSCAILIYTYNTMCVRCSQSVIIDFQHSANCFSDDLANVFGSNLKKVFIAGYEKDYESNLCSNYPDYFEKWIKDGIMESGDLTIMSDDREFGYINCSPEEAPEMIYHWQITRNK